MAKIARFSGFKLTNWKDCPNHVSKRKILVEPMQSQPTLTATVESEEQTKDADRSRV
jgi:hypothetical protein